jgi:hypothetical protein
MGPMSRDPRPPTPEPVARERTVDPTTGLPVIRYRGPHPPTLEAGAPRPHGAWRVLRTRRDGDAWVVDLETSTSARGFADLRGAVDDDAASAVLTTLEDAQRLGVAHGALTAERFWRQGDRVWVEGYGVGWRLDASPEADRRDAARALLALVGTTLSRAMRERLAALAGAPAATPASDGPTDTSTLASSEEPEDAPSDRPSTAAGEPPIPSADPPASGTSAANPTARPAGAATFVKGPPPGAKVRPGDTPWPARRAHAVSAGPDVRGDAARRRRLGLFALLMVAVAVLATLSVALQRRPTGPAAPLAVAAYVVDVRIEPAGLPPARLVVLQSPPGSRLTPGTVVGSVPRMIQLDREGTWRFEARFLERRSAPAELELSAERRRAEDRTLVLVFPDPPTAAR